MGKPEPRPPKPLPKVAKPPKVQYACVVVKDDGSTIEDSIRVCDTCNKKDEPKACEEYRKTAAYPEFGEAKRRSAGRLTLYGNIEFLDMDTATPDQIEQKVRHAIEDGGKEHTVLYPSAPPHQRHTDLFTANAIRYIEAGLKYGTF